jgi:hypothetical protein
MLSRIYTPYRVKIENLTSQVLDTKGGTFDPTRYYAPFK